MLGRLLLAGFVAIASSAASAQEWPARPLHIIVPFAPGGSTDVAARVIADRLSRALGQQALVENRAGANGNIGIEAAARSEPDGYTILVAPDAVVSNPHIYQVKYNALKDLVPVVQVSRQPIVLAAHPSLGVRTIPELVALVKQQPGLRYALGSGTGSAQHMVGQWLARIAGIELQAVAYRGGGQAITDLLAGHVQLGSLGSTPILPHYQTGALLVLAQTTKARSQSLPDVPTFEQAGIAGLVLDQWVGVFVPVGTPTAITARLNTEINKALIDPSVRANFASSAQDAVGGSSEAFAALVSENFAKYEWLTRELNMKAQ